MSIPHMTVHLNLSRYGLVHIYLDSGGGGLVVSMLVFYSGNASSNPAEAYSFSIKFCLKRTKINNKGPGLAH